MKTQRLTTNFFGHKVEVILNLPESCDKRYGSVPYSISDDFSEKIECGERSGKFESLPDDDRNNGGEGYELSGSWRIVELDYEKIRRVLLWNNHLSKDEALTEKLFIRYFGSVTGRHYFEKWERTFELDLRRMLAYFSHDLQEGQRFCDMIAEQVGRFEERQTKEQ